MKKGDDHLLRQEVQELTDFLRGDPDWEDLRKALARKGFSSDAVLLAGFMESEEGDEWGAFVTKSGDVYEYRRDTRPKASYELVALRRVTDAARAAQTFPAIVAALRMVNEGV